MTGKASFQHQSVILDACCVINLFATGYMEPMLAVYPLQCVVSSFVADKEALSVFDGFDNAGKPKKETIDLIPLINAGVLEIVYPNWSRHSSYLIELVGGGMRGMGEKISGAMAQEENWAIATDDRNARRIFTALMPNTQLITTLDFVKNWVEVENISNQIVSDILRRIYVKGRYEISQDHPLFSWASVFQHNLGQ